MVNNCVLTIPLEETARQVIDFSNLQPASQQWGLVVVVVLAFAYSEDIGVLALSQHQAPYSG